MRAGQVKNLLRLFLFGDKMGDYKDSLKEIAQLYNDRDKRAAARGFMLSCKESGIAYDVALSLLKSSATIPAADSVSDLGKSDFKVVSGGQDKTQVQADNAKTSQNEPIFDTPDLEVVEDSGGLDMAEIENKVRAALDDFCTLNNIEDMTKAPQRIWSAACTFIGSKVFRNTKILKTKKKTLNINGIANTNGAYDLEYIIQVLKLFIFLCNSYNKAFTMDAAEDFLAVSANFLSNHREKLTSLGIDPKQKAEQSLATGIMDGKINPTGSIANLNHNFNWNSTPQTAEKSVNIAVIYPTLPDIKAAQSLPGE